jgi:hypothetical protein
MCPLFDHRLFVFLTIPLKHGKDVADTIQSHSTDCNASLKTHLETIGFSEQ